MFVERWVCAMTSATLATAVTTAVDAGSTMHRRRCDRVRLWPVYLWGPMHADSGETISVGDRVTWDVCLADGEADDNSSSAAARISHPGAAR
jgi:hypothetical protein